VCRMLPRRLGSEAGRSKQLAGAEERWRRAARNVVAEEGQGVDGNRTTNRDEGGTDSRDLLAMRRALGDVCMHLRSSKLKAMWFLDGNSLGCLLGRHRCELRVGCYSRPRDACLVVEEGEMRWLKFNAV
jgi:hypothetical protein